MMFQVNLIHGFTLVILLALQNEMIGEAQKLFLLTQQLQID